MDLHGAIQIQAAPETVWDGLHDRGVLAGCVSGCDIFEQTGPDEYAASGSVKIGPIRSRITVTISFGESDPPHRIDLHLTAKGAMGAAAAVATIRLRPVDGGTRLEYDTQVKLSNRLGRLTGSRTDTAAQQLIGDFFTRFAAAISAETAVTQNPLTAEHPRERLPLTTPTPPAAPRRAKALWIGIGAGIGAALAATAAILLARGRSR